MTNQEQMEETQHMGTPTEVSYAGVWRRLGAVVIDMVLLYIAGMVLQLISSLMSVNPLSIIGIVFLFLSFLLYLIYFPIMEGSGFQATVGKMALNIKVTDGEGASISYLRAFGRHLAKILCFVIVPSAIYAGILYLWHDDQEFENPSDMAFVLGILAIAFIAVLLVGILTIINSQRKQCLHDFMASTLVVRK